MAVDSSSFQVGGVPVGGLVLLERTKEVLPESKVVSEICALLGYYVASCGNCVPTFRDNVCPIFTGQESE